MFGSGDQFSITYESTMNRITLAARLIEKVYLPFPQQSVLTNK